MREDTTRWSDSRIWSGRAASCMVRYHAAKSEIMAPIDEFLRKVDARTGDEVVQLRRRGQRLNIVAITGLGTTVVLVLVSFILVARQPFPGHPAVPGPRAVDAAGSGADRRERRPGHLVWTAWPLFMAAVVAQVPVLGVAVVDEPELRGSSAPSRPG